MNAFNSKLNLYRISKHLLLFAFVIYISGLNTLKAQPSGGPYGPVVQNYEIPKTIGKIYYVSPEGVATETGESLAKPTTIESAISRVVTGDVIILRGGTYRTGNLVFNQGITMQPYGNEQPVIKGSLVASNWMYLYNGLWVTKWEHLFPSAPANWWVRNHQGKFTPQHKFNDDMVFINGEYLQSAGWEGEVDENKYFINYETGEVYIGTNPKDKLVEITAFNIALRRTTGECNGKKSDKIGPIIRGITFTQYAYRAMEIEGTEPEGISPESAHGKEVVGTTIENCEISNCSRVAAYLRGDKLTIRNCKVFNTSTEGIFIISSNDVLLEKNIFGRNNIEGITGYFPAAVKIFNQCYRVTCNDNLVMDNPYSNGIWYDVGNVDGVFTNNRVEGIGLVDRVFNNKRTWPSESGFFFEISKGTICAGNVFINCENGIHILNSCDALVYNNTFINSTVVFGRNERSAEGDHFGWHPATGPGVEERDGHAFVNNILAADKNFKRPLLFVWQPPTVCERVTNSPLKEMDYNIYVQNPENNNTIFAWWSPAKNNDCQLSFVTLEELKKELPAFEKNGKYLITPINSVFKSSELENFQVLKPVTGAILPVNVSKVLQTTDKNPALIGAYFNLKK